MGRVRGQVTLDATQPRKEKMDLIHDYRMRKAHEAMKTEGAMAREKAITHPTKPVFRSEICRVRLTPEIKARCEMGAAEAHMSLSAFLQRCILDQLAASDGYSG